MPSLAKNLTRLTALCLAAFCLTALPSVFAQEDEPSGTDSAGPGVGTKIEPFAINDDQGDLWTLEDHLGKGYLVVYFYPAAMTGGCTAQACSYRDKMETLEAEGVEVVGVSGDSVNGLKIFKQAHDLNFALLSDVSGTVADAFGVPKRGGGTIERMIEDAQVVLKRGISTSRWTFVLDKQGTIIYRNEKVNARNDSEDVLAFIKDHAAKQ